MSYLEIFKLNCSSFVAFERHLLNYFPFNM